MESMSVDEILQTTCPTQSHGNGVVSFLEDIFLLNEKAYPNLSTVMQAALGGYSADRLGYAFVCGYQAAIRNLVAREDSKLFFHLFGEERSCLASFCVTEKGSAHPSKTQTRLSLVRAPRNLSKGNTDLNSVEETNEPCWVLSGEKSFVTLGNKATHLFVSAVVDETFEGEQPSSQEQPYEGVGEKKRNNIKMVVVPSNAPGVNLTPLPELPFISEVPHAKVHFDSVHISASNILPGDGYLNYVKAFRTVEDTHVKAAVLGHALRMAKNYGWPIEMVEKAYTLLYALDGISRNDPLASSVHVALSHTSKGVSELLRDPKIDDDEIQKRWVKDKRLFGVASRARKARLEKARSNL